MPGMPYVDSRPSPSRLVAIGVELKFRLRLGESSPFCFHPSSLRSASRIRRIISSRDIIEEPTCSAQSSVNRIPSAISLTLQHGPSRDVHELLETTNTAVRSSEDHAANAFGFLMQVVHFVLSPLDVTRVGSWILIKITYTYALPDLQVPPAHIASNTNIIYVIYAN